MIALDVLKTALIDLAHTLGDEIPLIVGGGFGLYLRQERIRHLGERTLFDQHDRRPGAGGVRPLSRRRAAPHDPHTDFGYPWLLHLEGRRWLMFYYHGRSRGACPLWVTEVEL